MRGDGEARVRGWARRAETVAHAPVTQQAKAGILTTLEQAAYRRMLSGASPDGTPFRPLSRSYLAAKRKRHIAGAFWQWSGESRRKLRGFGGITPRGVHLLINTPWSAAPHDGATIHHAPRTASSIALHDRQVKRGKNLRRRNNKRLRALYGVKTSRQARAMHRDKLRMERNARRRGEAMLIAPRATPTRRTVASAPRAWTATIPARPVLGMSRADAASIGRILTRAVAARLEGKPDA